MVFFILGLVCTAAIVPTYIGVAIRDFLRVRRELHYDAELAARDGAAKELELEARADIDKTDPGRDTVRFVWQAAVGVIGATGMILIVSHVWWWWYVMPLLAFGTGVAVITAFVVDPTRRPANTYR
jgi:hypothetical protein